MNKDAEITRFFLLAAALNEPEVVIDCVSSGRLPVDATWGGKPTALCYAALHGNPGLLAYLVTQGASVEHRDALDMTPLHYAALGGCETCWRTLCAMGASQSARNRFGRSPSCLRRQRRRPPGPADAGRALPAPTPPGYATRPG